jgi:hypothetical protein
VGPSSGGGSTAFGGRVGDPALGFLELHRRKADEGHRSTSLRVERVRTPLGPNANESAASDSRVSAPQKVISPLEDVEPLVLLRMDVSRRADARRHQDLD